MENYYIFTWWTDHCFHLRYQLLEINSTEKIAMANFVRYCIRKSITTDAGLMHASEFENVKNMLDGKFLIEI